MISFNKDGLPNSFIFIPLSIAPGFNAATINHSYISYPVKILPGEAAYTSTRNLLNSSIAANNIITKNKDDFYRTEVGKFYFVARSYISYPALYLMALNLKSYDKTIDAIYKQFNTNPILFAKILSLKMSGVDTSNLREDTLHHLYNFGIKPFSEFSLYELLTENNIDFIIRPRTKVSVLNNILKTKLEQIDTTTAADKRIIFSNIAANQFNSAKLNSLLRRITINRGLKKIFTYSSIASTL